MAIGMEASVVLTFFDNSLNGAFGPRFADQTSPFAVPPTCKRCYFMRSNTWLKVGNRKPMAGCVRTDAYSNKSNYLHILISMSFESKALYPSLIYTP